MTDNETTREKTFSEELPYFKERIKEVFDNYHNLNGGEDPLYIAVLRDSNRIVRKAEKEITRQQTEIEQLKFEIAKLLPEGCPYATQFEVSNKLEARIKTEAVKDFAERLKKKAMQKFDWNEYIEIEDIDNLVNEIMNNLMR